MIESDPARLGCIFAQIHIAIPKYLGAELQ